MIHYTKIDPKTQLCAKPSSLPLSSSLQKAAHFFTALLIVAICLAPLFAGEYQLRTDQILLVCKYGKSKLITAKICTGVSFAVLLALAMLGGVLAALVGLHGTNGANRALQTYSLFTSYPLTLGQAVWIALGTSVLVCLSFAMLVMFLSACLRTAFVTIIVSFLILIAPLFIVISPQNRLLFQLIQLFPAKAADFAGVFSHYFFVLGRHMVTPAVFVSIFSVLASVFLLPFIRHRFKNHQPD